MALCLLQSLRRARPASGRCVSHAAYCDRPASGNVLRDRWESGGHDKKRLEARQHQVIMSIIKLCLQSILRDPNSIPQEPWSLRDTLADWCNLCKSIIKLLLTRPCAESVAVVSAVSYEPSPNIELRIAFNHHPIHPNFSNVAKQRSPNLDCATQPSRCLNRSTTVRFVDHGAPHNGIVDHIVTAVCATKRLICCLFHDSRVFAKAEKKHYERVQTAICKITLISLAIRFDWSSSSHLIDFANTV